MIKIWEIGIANEFWKIAICAEEIRLAQDAISKLEYITGLKEKELETKTGKEIIKSIRAFEHSALVSIEKGIKQWTPQPSDQPLNNPTSSI